MILYCETAHRFECSLECPPLSAFMKNVHSTREDYVRTYAQPIVSPDPKGFGRTRARMGDHSPAMDLRLINTMESRCMLIANCKACWLH